MIFDLVGGEWLPWILCFPINIGNKSSSRHWRSPSFANHQPVMINPWELLFPWQAEDLGREVAADRPPGGAPSHRLSAPRNLIQKSPEMMEFSLDFYGFFWISIDFWWISMDFSWFLWIFLDFRRFLMDFYGFFLISMDPYGFPISTNVKWRGFQTYERWKWLENWEMEFDTWNSHEGKGNSMLFNECDANNCTPFSVWQTPKLPTFFPTLRSYIEVS